MSKGHLNIQVSNLGPIRHAKLDLRPLTVLIGKNNSGKTYLAQTIYAAHKAVEARATHSVEENRYENLDLSSQEIAALRTAAGEWDSGVSFPLPAALHARAERWVGTTLNSCGSSLTDRLHAYFGIPDLSQITRWGQQQLAFSVDLTHTTATGEQSFLFGHTSKGSKRSFDLAAFRPPKYSVRRIARLIKALEHLQGDEPVKAEPLALPLEFFDVLPLRYTDDVSVEDLSLTLQQRLSDDIWRFYLQQVHLSGSAHYLPAGRSGLLEAWTDVIRLRLQLERERFGLVDRPDPSLGGIALDYLDSLYTIFSRSLRGSQRRPNAQYRTLGSDKPPALSLLQHLMQGQILVGAVDDLVPTLEYQQGENRIPIRLASSMVADLAPLAMWIEHLIRPGDLLIIDEPESHLHPSAIRLVARVLVRLVNRGVRVVCATHSSVLIHELSNCMLRSHLRDKGAENLGEGYSASDCIRLDDIAVHRFNRPTSRAPIEVEQVDIEQDWGIPEDEYVEVYSNLSDQSAWLMNQLG